MNPNNYLILAAILFTIGAFGVLVRRNAIIVFMSVELMLNATNINFVAFSEHLQDLGGQVFVFFALTVAAAEVAALERLHDVLGPTDRGGDGQALLEQRQDLVVDAVDFGSQGGQRLLFGGQVEGHTAISHHGGGDKRRLYLRKRGE
mgnify:CR=1 FL=1